MNNSDYELRNPLKISCIKTADTLRTRQHSSLRLVRVHFMKFNNETVSTVATLTSTGTPEIEDEQKY